jgi:hypothetical protein
MLQQPIRPEIRHSLSSFITRRAPFSFRAGPCQNQNMATSWSQTPRPPNIIAQTSRHNSYTTTPPHLVQGSRTGLKSLLYDCTTAHDHSFKYITPPYLIVSDNIKNHRLSCLHLSKPSRTILYEKVTGNMRFASFALGLALTVTSTYAATICNGDSALCDRSYSNVTFIGAHDSYAVGSSIADNQDKDVTAQLVGTLQKS